MNYQEWLAARSKGITGTAAAAIMGASPYMSNVDLWEVKTGRKPAPVVDNDLAKYGQAAEKHLIALFTLDYPQFEVKHKEYDLRFHPEHEWLIGSIDGELTDRESGQKGILEIKTASIMNTAQSQSWRDGIPDHYFYQVLHYLLVTGFDFVVVKAQLKYEFLESRLTTMHYKFTRADVQAQLDELLKREKTFWQYVQNDVRPPLTLPRI